MLVDIFIFIVPMEDSRREGILQRQSDYVRNTGYNETNRKTKKVSTIYLICDSIATLSWRECDLKGVLGR